ncbi:hypothetical protein BDW02DRAFT_606904 [Decorospora gaudefroyi]|uniref:Uncharacterized protein n=1 Tax=Decorospora gaudefroyi TaxID=184978 RepID=A0A6A5KD56_9PLEO|nr:hypothetical protein BDW02DRAFT_606904 [Decorospora gaudefroyi]
MAELQTLQFDKTGMLNLDKSDKPAVGHFWETVGGIYKKRQPVSSTLNFLFSRIEDRWPTDQTLDDDISGASEAEHTRDLHQDRGMRKIIEIIFTSPPFTPASTDEKETFVTRHPDLDLQNILTDNQGDVIGILDWHEAVTAPRCVGYAALPHFLTHAWHPGFSLQEPPYLSWTVDHYRRLYADAMKQACVDGKYTYKSAMYQAVYVSVTRGGSAPDVVNKVLLQLPGLRLTNLNELQERIGRGWKTAEEYLEVEVAELMAMESG